MPNQSENGRKWSFASFSAGVSAASGSFWTFVGSCALILLWLVSGPFYHYSDTWQLVANTVTTLITFLMVFVIQNTQNRDTRAINLKLDEIIRSIHEAHNEMIDIEKLSDAELDDLAKRYERIRAECEQRHRRPGRTA